MDGNKNEVEDKQRRKKKIFPSLISWCPKYSICNPICDFCYFDKNLSIVISFYKNSFSSVFKFFWFATFSNIFLEHNGILSFKSQEMKKTSVHCFRYECHELLWHKFKWQRNFSNFSSWNILKELLPKQLSNIFHEAMSFLFQYKQ